MKQVVYDHSCLRDISIPEEETKCIEYLAMLFEGHFDEIDTDDWLEKKHVQELFDSMKEEADEPYEKLELTAPLHVLFMMYDGTKPVLCEHLTFEESEKTILYTTESETPFHHCENMLLQLFDSSGTLTHQYYLENEFDPIGDWYQNEAYEVVRNQTGLDPEDSQVILVSVSS